MSANDKLSTQFEHLQAKYVGTGHPDLTRYEWAVNVHRDSYASYIGHYSMMSYMAIAENEPIARVRYNMLEKMARPVGVPPVVKTTNNNE